MSKAFQPTNLDLLLHFKFDKDDVDDRKGDEKIPRIFFAFC